MDTTRLAKMLAFIWQQLDHRDAPLTLPPAWATETDIVNYLEGR
jgi:hypothetical protein